MKKVLSFVIIVAMMLATCSCTNKSTDSKPDDTNEESENEVTWTRDGDYIVFGHYEQDGNLDNGPEPIEWEIVREEDGRMLLISRYILDLQSYNTESTNVTWETCSLRAWLNEDFINTAFDDSEQKQILTVINSNPDNAYYGTEGGNDTEDRVFCLSVEEILDNYDFQVWNEEYKDGCSQALMTERTQSVVNYLHGGGIDYEITSEAYTEYYGPHGYTEECIGLTCGYWWLRSPGGTSDSACPVDSAGGTGWDFSLFVVPATLGVRPAIYLKVE